MRNAHKIDSPTFLSSEELLERLCSKTSAYILEEEISLGDAVVRVARDNMFEFFKILKEEAELQFNSLSSVTCVDWMDLRPDRFEMIYHVYSFFNHCRLRVKINVPERKAEVDSLCSLWSSANFMEREVWDMYGISFKGHPNLKRILMYEEFVGHPLRKDYPLRGKQPRVALRHPEVSNSARDMSRSPLVQIKTLKNTQESI